MTTKCFRRIAAYVTALIRLLISAYLGISDMQTFGGHTDVCMEWTYCGCFKELQFLYRRIVMKNNNKVIFIEDQKKTVRGENLV